MSNTKSPIVTTYLGDPLDGIAEMCIPVNSPKLYVLSWDGWCFYPIRRHAHKLLWKHIYHINPSMHNKKLTWFCLNRGCD